jgi:urease accessory protein UreH
MGRGPQHVRPIVLNLPNLFAEANLESCCISNPGGMVTVDPITMHKRLDPETDLTLIDPTIK